MSAWLAEKPSRLANLDQVAVCVADVRTDLAPMILWLGQELGPFGQPLVVDPGDVRYTYVEERAAMRCAGWRCAWSGLMLPGPGLVIQQPTRAHREIAASGAAPVVATLSR